MAVGKDYFQLILSHGGLALDVQDILESDFVASAGTAYSPPEEGSFRRIVGAREIQLLAQFPGIVNTYQTTLSYLRLPANTITDSTNDAGNGRVLVLSNYGTTNLVIQNYLGTTLFTIAPSSNVIVYGIGANAWEIIKTGGSTIKSGSVAAGSFAGNPKTYSVVFAFPFASNNYSVTVTGADSRSWYTESLLSTGFIINSSANQALTGLTHWHAVFN